MYQKPVTSFAVIRHVFRKKTSRLPRKDVTVFTYICLRPYIYMSPPLRIYVFASLTSDRQYGDELNKLYFHARPSTTSSHDQVLLPRAIKYYFLMPLSDAR